MRRYDALELLAERVDDELIVTNLANTATEWHTLHPRDSNLYFVGMGMVTPYATGLALALPHRKVLALDGDGGLLFDLGILGCLAEAGPGNLTVLVFDNGGYVSTGQSPATRSLTSSRVSLSQVARGAGLTQVSEASSVEELRAALENGADGAGPTLVVARVDALQAFTGSSIPDAKENKYRFARHVEATEGRVVLRPSAREHGAPAAPDPVSPPADVDDEIGDVIHAGLRENGIDFIVGLPSSGLVTAQDACMADPSMEYVPVAHEGTGIGLCAGAWFGGRTPAALYENFGLYAAAYQLLRGHLTFGIPTLLVLEYRGDAGDREFFSETGERTEPFLTASGVNHRVVRRLADVKPAIRDGLRWTRFALRPYAVVVAYDLMR